MEVVNNLFEGLTRLDKNHQPKPAVAERIEESEDWLTYTFHLRDNAKWSNGEPVTAQDFEYAWKRVMDPETASSAVPPHVFHQKCGRLQRGEGEC